MKTRLLPIVAIALTGLLITAGGSEAFAQPGPRISQAVKDRIAAEGRARVIVQLATVDTAPTTGRRSAAQIRQRRTAIAQQRERLRTTLGGAGHRFIHEFADAPFVALDIDASALADLESAGSPAVQVLEDRLLAPTLAESVPLIEADRAHAIGLNGAGTVIAILDSGVDGTHPFIAPRLIAEACFSTAESGTGGDCPNGQATQTGAGAAVNCAFAPDTCRHGTHVAGIALGSGSEFSGVAPGANLIAIQVFHSSTQCYYWIEESPCARAYESDIVAGLEYVYELRDQYNIAAVNMSLGGDAYDSACDAEAPLFAAAIDNLKSVGIATVAASGNGSLTNGISVPACVASAISVGATTDDDEVAWFSNVSADLDLFAPGTAINSSVPGGGFEEFDGTSMAAPHVAGAWAIYKQAFPSATVDEALATFVSTGIPITDTRGTETKPRIRVSAALGLEAPEPTIDSISPSTVTAFGPDFTLTVHGAGFVASTKISIDGVGQTTTYLDENTLTAWVPSTEIPTSGSGVAITVTSPAPGGGTSNAQTLNVLVPSLQVDSTVAEPFDPVTVTVTNPPGSLDDWVALATVGSPITSYVTFAHITASSPSWTVTMPQVEGQYEFRLFVNNTYTLAAVSATVTVGDATPPPDPEPDPDPPTLTPSTTTAAPGASVTVTLEGGLGGSGDWLALAPVGSSAASYLTFTKVGAGVTTRDWTVAMPQTAGQYEFRLFLDNGYVQAAASPPITVETPPPPEPTTPTLTPSTTTAEPGASVTVTLEGGSGDAGDWLALAPVGSSAASYLAFTKVGAGITTRDWTVTMPQTEGQYEFRLFINNGYVQVAASAPITVETPPPPEPTTPTLTPSATTAAPGTAVTVTLEGGSGDAGDWLALAPVGSSAASYLTFTKVGTGVTMRDWTVTMPQTAGQYEFRLFINNGYVQVAASPPITVETPPPPEPTTPTLTPSTTTAEPGASVTVTLEGGSGDAGDWLALAPVGSSAASYLTFTKVGAGITTRDWTVTMPQTAGQYEFRLFINNGYVQVAASPPITVEAPPPPEPAVPTLTPSTTTAVPGASVTVTLEGGSGDAGDWLAFARVGSSAASYLTFTKVGAGVTTRDWTVTMPQAAGPYEFRLFINNGYVQVAASPAVSSP